MANRNLVRFERTTDNLKLLPLDLVTATNKWGIPPIAPMKDNTFWNEVANLTFEGFNYLTNDKKPEEHAVHFFLDDYQFQRIWNSPTRYNDMIKRCGAVCSPDFSCFYDYPLIVQMYNHYRKHFLACYWQSQGAKVIPTISWSDERSWQYCWIGEPRHAPVIVSTVGVQQREEDKILFLKGWREMLRVLEPSVVMVYGKVPSEIDNGEVKLVKVEMFQTRFERRDVYGEK